nr:coiled-coil and C2 domain-containing protein 1-like isoform X2 [Halyomorpha halys]
MPKTKRETTTKQARSKIGLPQLDIFNVPDVEMDDDEDDAELEAELMAIISPGSKKSPMTKPKALPIPEANLDSMVAASLQDIPSDVSSGDEDDPNLLAELQAYTGEKPVDAPVSTASVNTESNVNLQSLLQERLQMYKSAEENAKSTGDTAKARRLGRGLKTLNELLKKAQRGGQVDENEIPLPVAISTRKPTANVSPENEIPKDNDAPPVPPRRSLSKVEPVKEEQKEIENVLKILTDRRDEYKKAAVAAKKSGDIETAKAHVRVIKQFESVIEGVKEGQPVDLSTMPPSPGVVTSHPLPLPQTPPTQAEKQRESPPSKAQEETTGETSTQPISILEALEQRLAVFRKQAETAKAEGNSSKERRMGRISKQYEDAIRLHKAGKEIPVDDLPTPPGFPPIPVEKKPPPPQATPSLPTKAENKPPSISPKPQAKMTPSPQPSPSTPQSGRVTRQEKQLALLLKRQREWKEAAIAAKKSGNLAKAKECLRQVKGIDPLIEASRSGLPIDMATIPVAPQDKLNDGFEVVSIKDCLPGTNVEIYEQLKVDLKRQFEMCIETKHHYKALGDVANANMFEQLAVHTKKDLDRVTVLHERDDPVPRFHYEMRNFSIVKANTDLNDNDLQLSIINGINYNVPNPKEIDTYVRYEFPFPSEEPKRDKTSTVYNTNNPEYLTTFVIPILRTNRACQRVFKRHSLKLEIWSKGGFLRSDSLVGTVNVKLQPLETKCTIHDSFDLMDGRKQVGGKLEVKLRVRHPIQAKEVQQVQEKWLIID